MKPGLFKTDQVLGKNTALEPNAIADGELQASTGTTPIGGAWESPREDKLLYSGTILGMAVSGDPDDHEDSPEVAYIQGRSLYLNGGDTGFDVGGDPVDDYFRMKPLDGGYLTWGVDDGKPWIYDGTHMRQLGPWVPRRRFPDGAYWDVEHIVSSGLSPLSVTGITNATQAVVTYTDDSNEDSWSAGSFAYIEDVVGMTEINGVPWRVVSIDTTANTITLDCDSSDFGTYSSGGTLNRNGCGLSAGTYQFMYTCCIQLSDGTVIESKPRLMTNMGVQREDVTYEAASAGDITVENPTDAIYLYVNEYLAYTPGGWGYEISGTAGTDWKPGFRVYRTKNGGADFYLQIEKFYDGTSASPDDYIEALQDSDGTGYALSGFEASGHSAGVSETSPSYGYVISGVRDVDLTNVAHDTTLSDRGTVPDFYDCEVCGQHLGAINRNDRRRFRWSSLDGIDYWDSLNDLYFPENLFAVGVANNKFVLYGSRRIWTVDLSSGMPLQTLVDSAVGHVYPTARARTEDGSLVLRDDGLWLFSAGRMDKVSRRAYTSVDGEPVSIMKNDDLLIACSKNDDSEYPGIRVDYTDAGPFWHDLDSSGGGAVVRGGWNGKVYRLDSSGIWEVGGDTSYRDASGTSKTFGDGETYTVGEVWFMAEGEGSLMVTLNVNTVGDVELEPKAPDGQVGTGEHGRTRVRFHPARVSGEFFTLNWSTTGKVRVYGYGLEVVGQ